MDDAYQDVSISGNYFIANGKAYSIDSIFWAELKELRPQRWQARLLMFIGLTLLFANARWPLLGAALMLLGIIKWKSGALRYAFLIHTSTGEHQILVTKNPQYIDNIISTLNVAQAIRIEQN